MSRPLFQVLLEQQINRAGDGVALHDPATDLHLSCHELRRQARYLAHMLAQHGAGAEARVGVLLPAGVDRIVALLAILETGAAFVPLDPEYPQEHLEFLASDSELNLLLTTEDQVDGKITVSCPLILLRRRDLSAVNGWQAPALAEDSPSRSEWNPHSSPHPQGTAYVIYTSGTSGRPKGVMVSHGALASYLEAGLAAYRLGPTDRVPQLSSISFDFSICEIFLSLTSGATLVLARRQAHLSVDELYNRGQRLRLSVFFLPTALWQELARGLADTPLPPSLRLVSFGGEKVAAPMLERWCHTVGQRVELWNGYGPTEATVEVTLEPLAGPNVVSPTETEDSEASLIGRPFPGVRTHIFDARLHPVAEGDVGELCLGGDCLARAYLGRAVATACSFVPDPQSNRPGERLYKTGDLVRRKVDGRLEIAGRTDLQLKIRGFRVEPQEIEARLLEHPAVEDAVVVAPKLPDGGRLLQAHVIPTSRPLSQTAAQGGTGILGVGRTEGRPSGQELRDFLATRLPSHLLPAQFQIRQSFPHSANGKIDRRALERSVTRARSRPELQATPRDSTETLLSAVWRGILNLSQVGIEQNFFELGGDSILALRVVTGARRQGLLIRARDLFDHPTIARLARVAKRRVEVQTLEMPVQEGEDVPLTPVARWFFEDSRLADHQHFNQSMLVRTPPLNPHHLRQATAALIAHHEALRLCVLRSEENWRQRMHRSEKPVPAHTLDLQALPLNLQRSALETCASQVQTSLRFRHGPLIRAVSFHLGPEEGRLLLAAHHLVVDGVTWAILFGDFDRALHHLASGEPPALPPVPLSFRQWAFLQSRAADSKELRRQLPYWLDRPQEAQPLPLDHPVDRLRENTRASHFRVAIGLDDHRTRTLLRRVPAAWGTRIDEVLLTALVRALAPWTGHRQLLIDLEGHGREEIFPGIDLSRTVGWFTTTFPVHLALPNSEEPGAQLCAMKETLRRIPQHGIGYGLLRYLCGDSSVGRKLRQMPAPEVSFNYLGQLDALFLGRGRHSRSLLSPASENRGLERTLQGHRDYVLEVDGGIVGNRLWINLHGSLNLHRPSTFERLGNRLRQELELLIDACLEPGVGGYTPSDFPMAGLKTHELHELLGQGRGGVEDLYPLSPLQQGMLFHRLTSPRSAVYFEQSSWRLDGPLDRGMFRRTWQLLMERHAVLRTTFAWKDLERPLQIVLRNSPFPFSLVDHSAVPQGKSEKALDDLLAIDRQSRPTGLRQPLWRLHLIALSDREHRFVWSYDHALVDGWSLALLFEELFTTYEELCAQRPPQAPPRPPFRNYIAWLNLRDSTTDVAFWRRQLAAFEEPTTLPFDRLRPTHGDAETLEPPHDVVRVLSVAQTAELEFFTRHHRLTLSTLVQAAWALLLSRHGEVSEVLFGATVSGRPEELEGAESIVGLLIQTLPMRLPVPSKEPLLKWLEDVQQRTTIARDHQGLSLGEIRRCAPIPAERPLFESLVVFENYPVDGAAMETDQGRGTLRVGDFQGFSLTNYPLTLGAIPGDRLTLGLSAHRQYFDETTALRVLNQVDLLLSSLLKSPESLLEEHSLLSAVERHQLLREWNDSLTERNSANPSDLASSDPFELFLARVRHRPHAPAVYSLVEGSVLTYRALAHAALFHAHRLEQRGVQGDEPVALLLSQGAERLVALLAVLAAGAAYVPLDPTYPPERLRQMLRQCGARLVISDGTTASLLDRLTMGDAPRATFEVMPFQPPTGPLPSQPSRRLHHHPEGAAYILFTSGSSGLPKGVVVSRRSLAWYCLACSRHYGLTAKDRVLQLASMSFDISVGEIFPCLAAGGSLVLYDEAFRGSVSHFYRRIQDLRVSVLFPPTAFWHELAAQPNRGEVFPSSLRLVSFGGESVHFQRLEAWQETIRTRVLLFTGYGPTEATVEATVHPFPSGSEGLQANSGTSPLGRPIDDVRVHLLNQGLHPVTPGALGEIYLAGPGLARGYHRQPAQTAAAFLPNPFTAEEGSRVYRTGDLGHFDHHGTLHFIGRRDRQVKVGGLRVEPGEVEAALRRLPRVREAAVVPVPRIKEAGHHLAAFLVGDPPTDQNPPAESVLRRELLRSLPSPLLPSVYRWLPQLPLSPAGKVDYRNLQQRALKAPFADEPSTDDPRQLTTFGKMAHHPTLELLLDVWRSVFERPKLDANSDFFELGGHSLLATRLISRLRLAFGIEIPLRLLFENPTAGSLARALQILPRAGSEAVLAPLRPRSTETKHLPLSFAQHRMWIQEQLRPGDPAWLMADVWCLRGTLEVFAFKEALTFLVARHEALRTTFPTHQGQPRQVVASPAPHRLPQIDLTSLPRARRGPQLQALLHEESNRPLQLAEGLPLRTLLFQVEEEEHVFLRLVHHIAGDAWSDEVFYRELSQAFCGTSLPALAVQPADFALWQRQRFEGGLGQRLQDFWQRELHNVQELRLPTDRPAGFYRSGRVQRPLPAALSTPLTTFATTVCATRFMVLLAAFSTLLERLSDVSEVVVGTPTHGRDHQAMEGLVGCFVNPLVLRLPGSGPAADFNTLVQRVRQKCLAAYAHQDLPFDLLVETLNPPRRAGSNPFFEVMVEHVVDSTARPEFPGISVEAVETGGGNGPWALSLELQQQGEEWRFDLEYDASRFDTTTAHRMLAGLESLLQEALKKPGRRPTELPLLTPAQVHQLRVEWPSSYSPAAFDDVFPILFRRQAAARPEAIALVDARDRQASYGDLAKRVEHLAHHLRDHGVSADARVGLLATREIETLLRVLAVLRVGGAYVPLDPVSSSTVQVATLYAADARWFLGKDSHSRKLAEATGARLVFPYHRLASPHSSAQPMATVHPQQLAYVMTTSGSSGRPRTVGVEHRSLAWYCRVAAESYGLNPVDRVLQFAPLTFDISVEEIFPTLATGATLVLRDEEILSSSEAFWRFCDRHSISLTCLSTSFWHRLAEDVQRIPPPASLRRLAFGGEAVRPELLKRWQEVSSVPLFDTYGPTETTVVATLGRVGRWPAALGRPLAGVRAHVLDANLLSVPCGTAGELVLGGDGLARGYLNSATATASRFVPDPFSHLPGARLYRTGDRMRWLADGRLEFLGRLDRETKIRGFRVDPSAVEATLRSHPALHEAVVEVRTSGDGTRRLVAWFVPRAELPPPASLRAFLSSKLPEWMVPTTWAALPELPLTVHGKVDRSALSTPELPLTQDFTAPRTHVEATLTEAFRQALGRERVGIHDDFFSLGGDSILAIRATALARQKGVQLKPADLLQHTTVARLGEVLLHSTSIPTSRPNIPENQDIPLTPIQRWFFAWHNPKRHHFNQSYLLQLEDPLQPSILHRAAEQLLRTHDALRLRFRHHHNAWHQCLTSATSPPPILTVDFSHLPQHLMAPVIEEATRQIQGSLHLGRGPLLRLALLKLPEEGREQPWRLFIIVHHLAVDGVSWPNLLGDLELFYRQAEVGRQPLPPRTNTSYREWALGLTHYATSGFLEPEVTYWQEALRRRQELPVDPVSRRGHHAPLDLLTVVLEASPTAQFLHRQAQLGVRPDALLLTALARAFQSYSRQPVLLVEMEDHGRADIVPGLDLSRAVGWFTATYPVALELESSDEPMRQLARNNRTLLAVPNRGVGFGLLRYLSPETPEISRLRKLPPPEVNFNYLGQLDPALASSAFFRAAQETAGPDQGHPGALTHKFDINCRVQGGRLIAEWSYSPTQYFRQTVEELAHRWLAELNRLVAADETKVEAASPRSSTP